jgi:transposase
METLATHYARLLGTDESWRVEAVDLRLEDRQVEIRLKHVGSGIACPECGRACGLADHADERRWRHLDTMQFTTELVARLPRCRCPEHGVKTIIPPWAGKHSRFTLLFEAFAIEVLQACRNVKAAAALLGLSWDSLQTIMNRAVERGLERREATPIPHLGIDEKSFGRGHDYITVLTDLNGSRVLDVVPDRTQVAAEAILQTLTPEQRQQVQAVAADMLPAYANAVAGVKAEKDRHNP